MNADAIITQKYQVFAPVLARQNGGKENHCSCLFCFLLILLCYGGYYWLALLGRLISITLIKNASLFLAFF